MRFAIGHPRNATTLAGRLPLTILYRRVGNWVENTNLGIERANGDWITFLHQDDLWRPGRLAAVGRQRCQLANEVRLDVGRLLLPLQQQAIQRQHDLGLLLGCGLVLTRCATRLLFWCP
jgi:glycosyltransferase involved in cell wall biosynthesis